MPPKRKRQSKFDKHSDGARILQDIITRKITKTEAAKLLHCSKSFITQYMQRHNLKVQDKHPPPPKKRTLNLTKSSLKKKKPKVKSPPKQPSPQKEAPINELADQTIILAEDQLKYLSPANLKTIQQRLLDSVIDGQLEITMGEFVALSREIRYNFELQLKHGLTNKQEDQIIKLDEKDVEALLAQIEEVHCDTCKYRQRFIDTKNSETTTERLAPE